MNALTQSGSQAPSAPTDALSDEQLKALTGSALSPDQSAALLGHATGQQEKNIGNIFAQSQQPQNNGFTDSIHQMDPTGSMSKGLITGALPAAGAIGGGILGGAIGGLAASPTIVGIPAGVLGGSAIGAGIGSGVGEEARQALNQEQMNPQKIGNTALAFGAGELVGGPATALAGKGFNLLGAAKGPLADFLSSRFGTKTLQEVQNTAPDAVSKLSSIERKAYFDNQKTLVDQKYNQMEESLTKESNLKQATLQSQSEDLLKQSQTASRDETIALRPKVIQAMGKQSQQYRKLVADEIAPVKDTQVDAADMRSFVQSKFGENPEMAQMITNKIGIPQDGMTTIGKIYDKTTALRQDIGTAANRGSRTFTPDEKATDDAINTLTDYLSSKGVDLSKARQFWAQYAPVRNQMVNTIRPFNQAGTETGTFSKLLQRVASGKDVNNENFMGALKELTGSEIGPDTKAAISAMNTNEKAQVAAKIEAQVKAETQSMMKDKELTKLSEQQFEAERKGRIRDATKTALKTVLLGGAGYEVNNILKKTTGIGL